MPSAAVTRRVGPLAAVEGERPALAVGDVDVHHVRLSVAGLTPHLAEAPSGFVPWGDVHEIRLDVPTTWWPHPALGDSVGPVIEGLFGGAAIEVTETPTFPVHVRTADGAQLEWSATTHYLSGYRRKDAAMSARLVDHLVAHPEARGLLAQPVALLDRLAHVLRQPPPAAP
ncbi:hypothetical protein [Microbacterium aurum]|uniref:hypothetical protein n=1 Tax=Microbacterium aurum TaxID=36805 RepID=UPI0028E1FA5B|nr:hypothetical protein [Microbacterium aurum]